MNQVIVTVKRHNETRVRDMELPTDVDASELAEMIVSVLRWDSGPGGQPQPLDYVIEAHPLGRVLQPDESLGEAGVWDGAWLVLHPNTAGIANMASMASGPSFQPGGLAYAPTPSQYGSQTPAPTPTDDSARPMSGWRSLGINLPAGGQTGQPPPEEKPPGEGFVWKQVDK